MQHTSQTVTHGAWPNTWPKVEQNILYDLLYISTTLCPAFSSSQFQFNLCFFLSTVFTPSPFATHPLSYSFCLTTNLAFLLLSPPPFSLNHVSLHPFPLLPFCSTLSATLLFSVQFPPPPGTGEESEERCENRRKWWMEQNGGGKENGNRKKRS